jgi:flagellar biosynthesis/type III secretory pathway protein FliH
MVCSLSACNSEEVYERGFEEGYEEGYREGKFDTEGLVEDVQRQYYNAIDNIVCAMIDPEDVGSEFSSYSEFMEYYSELCDEIYEEYRKVN